MSAVENGQCTVNGHIDVADRTGAAITVNRYTGETDAAAAIDEERAGFHSDGACMSRMS